MNEKIAKEIYKLAKSLMDIADKLENTDDEEDDEDDYVDLSKANLTPVKRIQQQNFLSEIEPKELKRQLEPQQAIKQEIKPVRPLIKIEGLEETTDKIEEPVKKDSNEVILNEHEHYDKCPLCSGKLKKSKISEFDDGLQQSIACKTKGCKFSKTYKIRI
jgi:hypothetical protein